MASDGQPVQIPAVSLVHGSQAPTTIKVPQSGNPLPPSGNAAASAAAAKAGTAAKAAQPPTHPAPVRSADAQAQVTIRHDDVVALIGLGALGERPFAYSRTWATRA